MQEPSAMSAISVLTASSYSHREQTEIAIIIICFRPYIGTLTPQRMKHVMSYNDAMLNILFGIIV